MGKHHSQQGWNKLHLRFEIISFQSTSSLSMSRYQSVCSRWWVPNMVILNIRCFLKYWLLTSGQWINLYTYCPYIYGQDGSSIVYTCVTVGKSVGMAIFGWLELVEIVISEKKTAPAQPQGWYLRALLLYAFSKLSTIWYIIQRRPLARHALTNLRSPFLNIELQLLDYIFIGSSYIDLMDASIYRFDN